MNSSQAKSKVLRNTIIIWGFYYKAQWKVSHPCIISSGFVGSQHGRGGERHGAHKVAMAAWLQLDLPAWHCEPGFFGWVAFVKQHSQFEFVPLYREKKAPF